MAPSRRSYDSDSAASSDSSDSSDSYKGEKKRRGKPAPRVSAREERSRGGDRHSIKKSRESDSSSDSDDRRKKTARSNGRDLLLRRRRNSNDDEVERRRRSVNDRRREREPQQPPEQIAKEEVGGKNRSQKDEDGDREEGELVERYRRDDDSPKRRDRDRRSERDVRVSDKNKDDRKPSERDGRGSDKNKDDRKPSERDGRGSDKNKDDRKHRGGGDFDNEGRDGRKHKDDRARDSVRIRDERMHTDSRDPDEDGGGERRHRDGQLSGRIKDESRDKIDRGEGRRRDEKRHIDSSDSDDKIKKRKDDVVVKKRDREAGWRREGDSDSDEKRKDDVDESRRHMGGQDSGRMKDGRRRNDSMSSDEEDDEEGRRGDGRGVVRSGDKRRRRDSSDSDEEEHKRQKAVGVNKRDREERRLRNRSDSEEEDGKRKDDRLKKRGRDSRQHRHRDGDSNVAADANRKDDRVERRDREAIRRRGRDSDSSSGSPRRKEKNNDDGDRRRRDEEKNREKETKEDTRKDEPAVVVQQMPDANVIRTGGIYIPPHRMAQMMRDVQDKSSEQYQRLSWDALRKSINGLVNKVNATNIKNIIPELFSENLIRGRGLFCRSCMKSQMASPGFTDVFAGLSAVVNTKFPEVGKLLLKRIVLQLKRAYKRNDKPQLLAATKFIAHLVNQQVAHEIIALELLTLLLENPTDDSVEVAVGFVKECGALLQDFSPQGLHGIFERFRGILHEGEIDKRVQFLIEGLFAIRKAKFQGFPAIRPELDLVEQEDQFTHEVSLEDEIDPETGLDVFKPNPQFLEDEKAYEDLKRSILGDESSDDEEGSDAASDDEDEESSEEEDEETMKIKDETETNLVNLRRTIYLTIMSSVDFEEAGHKLLKIKLEPGQEMELCIMLLECCSQERTYLRYYGLLGQRFCMINKVHQENFEKCFVQQYSMIHRLETNKLRNVAKFFAHLLGTSALPWHVLSYIRLTEEDTTSSSRIFIKILFQELSEHLGIRLLNERLNDPTMQDSFESIFPKDNPKNTRFSINFFTSIGLGGITESLREYLKNMPRLIMQQQKPISESESDDQSGSSGSSSGSDTSSESDSSSNGSENRGRDRKRRRRS